VNRREILVDRLTNRKDLALFYIHQMNLVNSRNDLVVMMTALYKYRPGYYYYFFYLGRYIPEEGKK